MESSLFNICFLPNDQQIIHFVLNLLENTHVVLIIVRRRKHKVNLPKIADECISLQGELYIALATGTAVCRIRRKKTMEQNQWNKINGH